MIIPKNVLLKLIKNSSNFILNILIKKIYSMWTEYILQNKIYKYILFPKLKK